MEAVAGVLSDCCVKIDGLSSRSYVITSISHPVVLAILWDTGPRDTEVVKVCHLIV